MWWERPCWRKRVWRIRFWRTILFLKIRWLRQGITEEKNIESLNTNFYQIYSESRQRNTKWQSWQKILLSVFCLVRNDYRRAANAIYLFAVCKFVWHEEDAREGEDMLVTLKLLTWKYRLLGNLLHQEDETRPAGLEIIKLSYNLVLH